MALSFWRAIRSGFASEPKICANQRQEGLSAVGHRIKLRLDKAVAGMDLASLHQFAPTIDPLGVAPCVGHMVRKRALEQLVIGIAENTAAG